MREHVVGTNGIEMQVTEEGEGRPVILCHGFPELSYSWRHQLPALAAAGYRAIAPDQRGYGRTTAPPRVEDYTIEALTGDLIGLLDGLGLEKATFVGHDWGAIVVWALAQRHPERMDAVVGMSVPFTPRGPMKPTELFKMVAGDRFMYIVYFQDVGPADTELARDPDDTMRRTLSAISGEGVAGLMSLPHEGTGFLTGFARPETLPDWLSEDDVAHFASEFERTGFTGGLNWYRNLDGNWERSEHLAETKIDIPSFFIAGENDPVLRMAPMSMMDDWLTDLRGKVLIPGAGHWVQQERPSETNDALLGFLKTL